nr:hypothetical protein [uncultured Desulfobulbus sp.]
MDENDNVFGYGRTLGWELRRKTVLVEGTSDVFLFKLAANLECETTGVNLIGDDLAIIAAGEGDRGGTRGVIRELIGLRAISRTVLLQNGSQKYRFIGLFDNDKAGRQAVSSVNQIDSSILEYKDVFRLQPVMVKSGNLDPKTLKKTFERENFTYRKLDWEVEDLLSQELIQVFFEENEEIAAKKLKLTVKFIMILTEMAKLN